MKVTKYYLDIILAGTLAGRTIDVHLYTARTDTPVAVADFTEPIFTGYASEPTTVLAATVKRGSLVVNGPLRDGADDPEFAPTDGLNPQNMMGMFLTETVGPTTFLVGYEDFAAPVPLTDATSRLTVEAYFAEDLALTHGFVVPIV